MNKYIAWDNETNQLDPCWYPLVGGDKEISIIGMLDDEDHEQLLEDNACEIYQSTGKTDIHGQEIYYDFSIVKFNWRREEFIGIFKFDDKRLRAYLKIYNNLFYKGLLYSDIASDFEIIGNVKENSELIGEGK
jgi:hypothetical protein